MRHATFRKMMAQDFYGELQPEEKRHFDEHRASCRACANAYRQVGDVLSMMHQRDRQEPPGEYWRGFWDRLEPGLRRPQGSTGDLPWWKHLHDTTRVAWRPAYAAAFALLLIVIGAGIGRFLLQPEGAPAHGADVHGLALDARSEQVRRTGEYLDRSHTLLLGIVHSDTGGTLNLVNQKRISRELVDEARVLQASLKEPGQAQLRALVGDLEVILMHIANLEARYDLPAIELVRSGVNRGAILFKINIEQMRMDSPAPQSKSVKPNS